MFAPPVHKQVQTQAGGGPSPLQAKLTVNAPRDAYEHEADRVADRVAAAPSDGPGAVAPPPITRISTAPSGGAPAPASVGRVLGGGGTPLEPRLRRDMENRFGSDFSRVRVHTGPDAQASARELNARAYAVGPNIVFGAGQFAPANTGGRRLIAHELTHVVQQSGPPTLQRAPGDTDFVIHETAMADLEARLLKLYQELPRSERIALKDSGTVAVGLVTRRGAVNEPIYVYTTASNVASTAFQQAAERVGLRRWEGDSGATMPRQGPSRPYSPAGGPPPGEGGIDHAEQLMTGYADDHGYVVHGMAVSRRFCHDCPLVLRGYKGGRIKLSVITDPDQTLPNPRQERAEAKAAKAKAEAAKAEAAKAEKPGGKKQGGGGGGGGAVSEANVRPTGEAQNVKPAGAGPTVAEGRGGAVAPITTPEPAVRMGQAKSAHEGAWSMILSALLGMVRGAELKKAQDALVALGPEIVAWREKGYGVTVTIVAEVPLQPDVAAMATGVGDPGQVVKFNRMFVSQIVKPVTSPQTSMSENLAPGDPMQDDPHQRTLTQQIRGQMHDPYPVKGTEPPAGFRYETRHLQLPLLEQAQSSRQTPQAQAPVRNLAGAYKMKLEKQFIGSSEMIMHLFGRTLRIDQAADGKATPVMTLGTKAMAYRDDGFRSASIVLSGHYALGDPKDPVPWLQSRMEYGRDGLLLEWAKGLDQNSEVVWDALFSWRRT